VKDNEEYHLTKEDWIGILLLLGSVLGILILAGCISAVMAAVGGEAWQ
jgi:outer membrane murein-binding lipoprotein Lpp